MYVDDLEVIKTSNATTIKYRSLTQMKQDQVKFTWLEIFECIAGDNLEYEGV